MTLITEIYQDLFASGASFKEALNFCFVLANLRPAALLEKIPVPLSYLYQLIARYQLPVSIEVWTHNSRVIPWQPCLMILNSSNPQVRLIREQLPDNINDLDMNDLKQDHLLGQLLGYACAGERGSSVVVQYQTISPVSLEPREIFSQTCSKDSLLTYFDSFYTLGEDLSHFCQEHQLEYAPQHIFPVSLNIQFN